MSIINPMIPITCTRTSSTTTRIKTLTIGCGRTLLMNVLEHLPPQQGLRLESFTVDVYFLTSTRTSSTTTRIKTLLDVVICIVIHCTRTSSTTTRIKTGRVTATMLPFTCTRTSSTTTRIKTPAILVLRQLISVLEHLPPQQGLRLFYHH